jgi:hypothetical protein
MIPMMTWIDYDYDYDDLIYEWLLKEGCFLKFIFFTVIIMGYTVL